MFIWIRLSRYTLCLLRAVTHYRTFGYYTRAPHFILHTARYLRPIGSSYITTNNQISNLVISLMGVECGHGQQNRPNIDITTAVVPRKLIQ